MTVPGKLGRDEGKDRGPEPAEGATIHAEGGAPDAEGVPGDVLSDYRGQARKSKEERIAEYPGKEKWDKP
jgi:hypothetical protein